MARRIIHFPFIARTVVRVQKKYEIAYLRKIQALESATLLGFLFPFRFRGTDPRLRAYTRLCLVHEAQLHSKETVFGKDTFNDTVVIDYRNALRIPTRRKLILARNCQLFRMRVATFCSRFSFGSQKFLCPLNRMVGSTKFL